MKKLILAGLLVLLLGLTGCAKGYYDYEVHLKNGDVVTVCANGVGGVIDVGIRFTLDNTQVAMFAGDGIWFVGTPVESCK